MSDVLLLRAMRLISKQVHAYTYVLVLFMVAVWNRADHYIFILWFLSIFYPFFPRLISAAAHWMSTILPHMVWP